MKEEKPTSTISLIVSSAQDFAKSLGPPVEVFAKNCFLISAMTYGHCLLENKGYKHSFAVAASVPKIYAISSGVYQLAVSLLAKLRGKHDHINAGVAGCCMGLFQSSFLGSPFGAHLESCIAMGTHSMLEYKLASYVETNLASSTYEYFDSDSDDETTPPSNISLVKTAVKHSIEAAVMGSILACASGLSAKKGLRGTFQLASFAAKPIAIFIGLFTSVELLLTKLRGKRDDINAGIAGCCASLILPLRPDHGPNALLRNCVAYGSLMPFINALYTDRLLGSYFLDKKNGNLTTVLPPFILPLPEDIRNGFSAFHESLKKLKKDSC